MIGRLSDSKFSVGFVDLFSPREERLNSLHSDLDSYQILLPVARKELLFEFEEELGEGEGRESSEIGIDPGLNIRSFKVVDDGFYMVRLCNRLVLKISAAHVLPDVYSCDSDAAC